MNKTLRRTLAIMLAAVLIIAVFSCAAPPPSNQVKITTAQSAKHVVPVQRGDLVVSVSVDGNLNMPQAFDLHFGAPGDVKEVLVREGDRVKAGAILARLDDTTQRLDIKSSNNSVQTVLSNLYETVPRLPQFQMPYNPMGIKEWDRNLEPVYYDPEVVGTNPYINYPAYYASFTAVNAHNWAQNEILHAYGQFLSENYTTSASELYVAAADIDAVAMILEDTINNPDSGLGNMAPLVPADTPGQVSLAIMLDSPASITLILELRKAVEAVRQSQADIEKLRDLLQQGNKDEATPLFESVTARMTEVGKIVFSNVRIFAMRIDTDVYGKELTIKLYDAAGEKLNAALRGVEKGGLQSAGLYDNLRIARHYMELANGIIGSNDYVLQHGLSLKAENQYKVDLESRLIDLDNKKNDFLKTIIMAPVDGVIVSVGTKVNDVLSQQDYSSKGTIQLVDTSQIKFLGLVDEIDILKIKTGQKVTVSVDAIPDRAFPGTVSFISPFGTADTSGVVKFNVTVLLDPTGIDLKGGLTATADIGVSKTENTIMVPLAAVTTTKEGSSVNVEIDSATGKTEKRPVKLGTQNQQMVQILEGLSEGEKVVVEIKAADISVRTTPGPPPGTGGGGPPR